MGVVDGEVIRPKPEVEMSDIGIGNNGRDYGQRGASLDVGGGGMKAMSTLSSTEASSSGIDSKSRRNMFFCILVPALLIGVALYKMAPLSNSSSSSNSNGVPYSNGDLSSKKLNGEQIQVSTWNIAAINNNPFEYWMSAPERPEYEQLMIDIENFIENPGEKDVLVSDIFTEEMFVKLDGQMHSIAGWQSIRNYWDDDYKHRKIISEFMKDPTLGSKRLASMPDRITNTITSTADGTMIFRPTVINMYEDDLSTIDIWWTAWINFMFHNAIPMKDDETNEIIEIIPYAMLQPILKAKYPDITEQEEMDSLPLQTLCGAIFDCILVHMMNTVSEPNIWQPLKRTMMEALNKKKVPHTLDILKSSRYIDSDIITLQEVSSSFVNEAKNHQQIGQQFHIITPSDIDNVRDQNSVIFLHKSTFPNGITMEITDRVYQAFPIDETIPVANGDILAITATSVSGVEYIIASFHGDTNGLATKPVLDAIIKTKDIKAPKAKLIFGLDANTYEHVDIPGTKQDVIDWGNHYIQYDLSSCWGDIPQPNNYTTYNARTYLQPQLNKACKMNEKRTKGDVNPKDFILFNKDSFDIIRTWKDNTGKGEYIENMAFPTLQFPSDHGILSTILQPIEIITMNEEIENNNNEDNGEN